MMKIRTCLVLVTMMVTSGVSFAGESKSHCSFQSDHEISLIDGVFKATKKDKSIIKITADNQLYYNNQVIELAEDDRAQLGQYRQVYESFIRDVTQIAVAGAEFGVFVSAQVLGELFKLEDKKLKAFQEKMDKKLAKLKINLNENKIWSEERFEKIMDQEFADSFEANMESFADELSQDIESKADSVGFWIQLFKMGIDAEKIKSNVDARSKEFEKSIEGKAEQVCNHVKRLDEIETELVKKHPNIAWFDLFVKK